MQFTEKLKTDLDKQLLNSKVLLDQFGLIDEHSRLSLQYQDPRYIPFYYHLGKYVQPKNLCEIGFKLGLFSGCFLKSCKTVENFLAFEQKNNEFYSPRLGTSNIKKVYKKGFNFHFGSLLDENFLKQFTIIKWDLIIINDDFPYDFAKNCLDFCWQNLEYNGLLIVEHHKNLSMALQDFCKMVNKKSEKFETRYGTEILEK